MKCSTAFCNRPAPMPSFEVPAPFCKWCTENPGSGREQKVSHHWQEWKLDDEKLVAALNADGYP